MSLRIRAVSGVKWTSTSMVISTGMQFLQVVILARLLSPEDFGLVAMVAVVIGFAQAFVDMGISKAIIHRQDASLDQLSSLYWLNIIVGVILFWLVNAATPLVVKFYNEPRLTNLMLWTSLIFLIIPIGQQFMVLMQKGFKFDRLAKIEMAATGVGLVVAIISALNNQGVYSLVWGQVVSASTRSILLVRSGWRTWHPKLHFKRSDLRGYLSFGLYQMGERSVNYFSANADYLIIGRFLGPGILGVYQLAYELVIKPLQKINPILTQVAFPVFARKQSDDAALRRGYLEVIKLLALVVSPILIGLAVTAPLIIPLIFGESWRAAIPIVQILAIVGILKAIANPSGTILLAKGRADIGFILNVIVAIVYTIVFLFVVQFGVTAVAWSYAGLSILFFVPMWFVLNYVIKLDFRRFLDVLIMPMVFSVLMGITVYLSHSLLREFVPSKPLLLVGLVILGFSVYAILCLVFARKYFQELWLLLFRRVPEVA